MTEVIYDAIAQGVDFIICAVLLSSVIVLLGTTQQISTISANQQSISEQISYTKLFNQYDDKSGLDTSDVVSCIIRFRDELKVTVTKGGTKYISDPAKKSLQRVSDGTVIPYKVTSIQSEFTLRKWNAKCIKASDGVTVTEIQFY